MVLLDCGCTGRWMARSAALINAVGQDVPPVRINNQISFKRRDGPLMARFARADAAGYSDRFKCAVSA